ncbi:hypothetical protein Lser_V15G40229 [Lactuca serriola]
MVNLSTVFSSSPTFPYSRSFLHPRSIGFQFLPRHGNSPSTKITHNLLSPISHLCNRFPPQPQYEISILTYIQFLQLIPFVNNFVNTSTKLERDSLIAKDVIIICDKFDSHQTKALKQVTSIFLRGRFDIDGDKETQVNSPFHDYTDIPNNLVPYPPPQDGPQIQNPNEIHEQHPGECNLFQVLDFWFNAVRKQLGAKVAGSKKDVLLIRELAYIFYLFLNTFPKFHLDQIMNFIP